MAVRPSGIDHFSDVAIVDKLATICGGNAFIDFRHETYQEALAARPRDWVLLGEIVEFLIRQIANYQAGLDIAKAALEALARALANDRTGLLRERLLQKQRQIAGQVQARHAAEQEWLARRAARLNSC